MPFPHAITYVPGSSAGLVGDGLALLVEADPVGPLVASCRAAVTGGVDAVLTALSTGGSPGFALAAVEGTALRLVVGGRGQAEFAGGVTPTVSAAGAPGWVDRRMDAAPDLRLSLADPARPIDPSWPVLPIERGTVLAAALIVPALPAGPAAGPAAVLPPAEPGLESGLESAPAPAPDPDPGLPPVLAPGAVDPDAITGQVRAGPPPPPPTYVSPAPQPGNTPMVQAVMCASGHLNAPFVVGACRVCGAPVPAQAPFLAPRPILGVLVLASGETVPVDRDVLLGRAPFDVDSVNSVGVNPAGPRVVTLPSPSNDLSRTHVRVAIDGWLVQVTDLGSTNGTVATMPGQQAVRLRAHDPFVLVPGTVINLADEAQVRFELPHD